MRTLTITSQEYAIRYGCSRRYVNQMLSRNTGLPFMRSFRKSGGTWIIEVDKSWYQSEPETE
jgi:hypothetical protein